MRSVEVLDSVTMTYDVNESKVEVSCTPIHSHKLRT
jgi:hypothetical protein